MNSSLASIVDATPPSPSASGSGSGWMASFVATQHDFYQECSSHTYQVGHESTAMNGACLPRSCSMPLSMSAACATTTTSTLSSSAVMPEQVGVHDQLPVSYPCQFVAPAPRMRPARQLSLPLPCLDPDEQQQVIFRQDDAGVSYTSMSHMGMHAQVPECMHVQVPECSSNASILPWPDSLQLTPGIMYSGQRHLALHRSASQPLLHSLSSDCSLTCTQSLLSSSSTFVPPSQSQPSFYGGPPLRSGNLQVISDEQLIVTCSSSALGMPSNSNISTTIMMTPSYLSYQLPNPEPVVMQGDAMLDPPSYQALGGAGREQAPLACTYLV